LIHYLQHRLGRKWAPVDIPNLFYWLIGVECHCGTVVRSFDEHMDHHREHSEAQRREGDELLIAESVPPITIRLLSAEKMRIGIIARNYHQREGFETPRGFIDIWNQIHPRSGYEPNRFAVLHTFSVVRRETK